MPNADVLTSFFLMTGIFGFEKDQPGCLRWEYQEWLIARLRKIDELEKLDRQSDTTERLYSDPTKLVPASPRG